MPGLPGQICRLLINYVPRFNIYMTNCYMKNLYVTTWSLRCIFAGLQFSIGLSVKDL